MKRKYYFIPSLLVAAIIVYLSLGKISTPPSMPRIPHLDKVAHCIAYAGFATVLGFDTVRYRNLLQQAIWKKMLAAWLVAISLGGLMEYLQVALTSYRSCDWGDVVANSIGATLGVLLVRYAIYPLAQRRLAKEK